METAKLSCAHTDQRKCGILEDACFCFLCGSLIFNSNAPSIKPARFNYKIEINPMTIWQCMVKEDKELSLKLMQKEMNLLSIGKRTECIKILNKLVHKLQFRSQTFYIACYYLDIIIRNNPDFRIENAAIGALMLASKFDEIDSMSPDILNFQSFGTKVFFTVEELRRNEFISLIALNYKLNYFTSYHFLNFMFTIGIVFKDDEIISTSETITFISLKDADRVYDSTKEILLYFIEDPKFLEFSSLEIACACITVAREKYKLKQGWPVKLELLLNVDISSFKNCYTVIKAFYSNLSESRNRHKELMSKKSLEISRKQVVDFKSNSPPRDKREHLIEKEDRIESYRALSNEKRETGHLLQRDIFMFRSNDEKEFADKLFEMRNYKTLNADSQGITDGNRAQTSKLVRTREKNSTKEGYLNDQIINKKSKLSEDITSSDLIQKTRTLLLKSSKGKDDLVKEGQELRYATKPHLDYVEKDYYNNMSATKSKHRHTDLLSDIKFRGHVERNISSNIRDIKINSALYESKPQKFTNFNYSKKYDKTAFTDYKTKITNISSGDKYYSGYKESNLSGMDYKEMGKQGMDKLFNQEIIKKKIDREIYSRQKINHIAHIGSGNTSKEYNYISSGHQSELNDLLTKLSRPTDGKRSGGTHYEYKKQNKESFLY